LVLIAFYTYVAWMITNNQNDDDRDDYE
jgi:hypothetical protein